jgi:FkbM family methyltransferase
MIYTIILVIFIKNIMKNKLLKKFCGVLGFKLIGKEHFKNNRTLSRNSSLNISNLLKSIFSDNNIRELIQIGANDGKSFDELNYHIKKNFTKSLLVEPIKSNFEKLKKNYINCNFVILENSAISVNNDVSFLYKVDPKYENAYGSHIPAIPSFNKKHLINHGVKNRHITTEKVNSLSILELINKHKFNSLDLLFIDCEGYDGNIVLDFLLNVKTSPIIIFEFVHIDNNIFEKVMKKLIDKNYLFIAVNENIVCFPENGKINIKLN